MRSRPNSDAAPLWVLVGKWFLGLLIPLVASPATADEAKFTNNDMTVTASPWLDADAMFHRDPRWLGGDDAYSIDLGQGRVAWFFGDSFVEPKAAGQRRGATMVRNSVGLQTGYDPSSADFKAYWQNIDGKPRSFVADEGDEFFWPGGSILLDGKLMMCMMRARDAKRKLAFDVTGWGAVLIDNIEASPDQWQVRKLDAPQNDFGVLVGSASLVRDGEHVVAFSVSKKKHHDVQLIRWRISDAAKGNLTQPEWWSGSDRGWVNQKELKELPPPIIKKGQTEFTVHCFRPLRKYVQFQFADFPVSPIGFRAANSLTGPWSELGEFYQPKEIKADDPEMMLYAAKAHPELMADGLAITYCSNTFHVETLLDNLEYYFPRFLQVKLAPAKK